MSQLLNNPSTGTTSVTLEGRPKSKKDRARLLYISNPSLSREQFVDLLIKDLEIKPDSAKTYASQFAKEHNEQLGKPYKARNIDLTGTKKYRAYQIFSENQHLTRKEIIKLIEVEFGCSNNAAGTQCSNAAKMFNDNLKNTK